MKFLATAILFSTVVSSCSSQSSQKKPVNAEPTVKTDVNPSKKLFLDVHHVPPGKVSLKDVAGAHQKDLAVQGKYGVDLVSYWVDTAKGNIFCLAYASDSSSLRKTHAEAHGLLPDQIFEVKEGTEAVAKGGKKLFLDMHEVGPGKVTAKDVAAAHQKDLEVEKKYGVNLLNYWVDEKAGVIMCLAEAKDSAALIATHKEAHGLLPQKVVEVKKGQ